MTILRKVPRGSMRVRGRQIERLYLDDLVADPRWQQLRPVARRNMLWAAKVLARTADYATGTTRCTRLVVCQLSRFGLSTWQRCRRRLEAWGRLFTVRAGMCLADPDLPNEAAVLGLCVPKKTTPSETSAQLSPQTDPPTGERDHYLPVHPHGAPLSQDQKPAGARSARTVSPALARAVRKGPASTLSDEAVDVLTRPFLAAGWCPEELSWAIDHDRDGTFHYRPLREIRWPAGWLRWRLSRHLNEDGRPVLSPSQRAAMSMHPAGQVYLERNRAKAAAAHKSGPSAAWHQARAALERRRTGRS